MRTAATAQLSGKASHRCEGRRRHVGSWATKPSAAATLVQARPIARNSLYEGVVVYAPIAFDDGVGSKTRPCVVLNCTQHEVTVLPLTTSKRDLARAGWIPLVDWVAANLSRPCRAKSIPVVIERRELIVVIGELSDRDRRAIAGDELVLP